MAKKTFTITEVMTLQEDMNRKLDVIGEQFSYIKEKVEKIDKIEQDVEELKTDMKIVKLSLQNKVNKDEHISLENRVLVLEQKAA